MTPAEVAGELGISRPMVHKLMDQARVGSLDGLNCIKIGRLTRIPRVELERFISRLFNRSPRGANS